MYSRDYILRMIEMVGQLIAAILGKIKKGEYNAAEDLLSNLYYDVLKEDAAYFRDLPEDKLTGELLEKHNYTNGHLEILAELFNTEAVLSQSKGDRKSALTYSGKALRLFEYIDAETKTYSLERINKMEEIRKRMDEL
jgi:predicted translin family RNA/ssDNA-binding protein